MNLEVYNYIIESVKEITVINGEEYKKMDFKESFITMYEAARYFFRMKPQAKNPIKILERGAEGWKEISIENLLKKIKKNKTEKAKRALKGVEEEW